MKRTVILIEIAGITNLRQCLRAVFSSLLATEDRNPGDKESEWRSDDTPAFEQIIPDTGGTRKPSIAGASLQR